MRPGRVSVLLFLALLAGAAYHAPVRGQTPRALASFGPPQPVFDAAQMGLQNFPDTHTSFVWFGGQLNVFLSAGRSAYLLRGSSPHTLVPHAQDANGRPLAVLGPSGVPGAPDKDYAAFGSVFVDPMNPDRLIGLYHGERHCPQGWSTFVAAILVASSTDGGASWTRHGAVISGRDQSHACRSAGRPAGAGELSAAWSPDGRYLYIYYTDWAPQGPDQVHLARVPSSQITNPGAYAKWSGGSFGPPGQGGHSTAVVLRNGAHGMTYAAKPSVSFNLHLGRYLMVLESSTGFFAATSANGLTWSAPEPLLPRPPRTEAGVFAYPAVLDFSQASSMNSGQTGMIWYAFAPPGGRLSHSLVQQVYAFH